MANPESIRQAILSRVQTMDAEELQRIWRVLREQDRNLRHQPAPVGWVPLQVAQQIGRDRRHLTRSCPAWAAQGRARKFTIGRQLAWHLSPDLAADLRNARATRGPIREDMPQNVRGAGRTCRRPLDPASTPVLTAADRTSTATTD